MHSQSTDSYAQGSGTGISQCLHEEIIREHLKEYGCEVELNMELVDLEQDDEGVNVKVRRLQGEGGASHEETIRALYVVGADGARGGWMPSNFRLLVFATLQLLNSWS